MTYQSIQAALPWWLVAYAGVGVLLTLATVAGRRTR